jgi:hypothetical protein
VKSRDVSALYDKNLELVEQAEFLDNTHKPCEQHRLLNYLHKNAGGPCAYRQQTHTCSALELVRRCRDFSNNEIKRRSTPQARQLRDYFGPGCGDEG